MLESRRRREHGSSGELDVFGATSYFAGCLYPPAPDDDCRRPSSVTEPTSADRLYFQAKVVQPDTTRMTTTVDNSFRSPRHQQQLGLLHDHADAAECHATNKQQLQVVAARRRQPSGKTSKLAALLSFMVSPSPSPRASSLLKEKKNQEAPSSTRLRLQAEPAAASATGGDEREPADNTFYKAMANSPSSTSRESSMQLQGLFGAHDDDDDELDLGAATGDRRLQGITVVRGSGADEEMRWVVRCVPGGGGGGGGAWDDEERREKMMIDGESASSSEQENIKKDDLVEVERLQGDDDDHDDGNVDPTHSWDSDSSSNLFDLDLEYR